jgi:hypothetical protein
MPAPAIVLDLVERFHQHLATYKQNSYNEEQLRIEFLNPMFQALGWDMENAQGYAAAYKEVIHEDAIRVAGVTKAPDYAFRIGGVRKFFLEAKKPAVNIKDDIHPAYQLRRYAWSAKLPLSILADFEEFAVYDCRIKPDKGDPASTARVLYLRYTDYAARWDEIAGIFGKEAILKGSFDQYAESHKAKRGTTEVDAAFLEEIERWRELLARNLTLRNPGLSARELNFAVQQTIDRIIFLRICEDRGIEPYGELMGLQNGTQVYPRLVQKFLEADRRYNSGLFHFAPEKGETSAPDTLTPGLTLDDKVLKDIFKHLYYPDSPYEFSVLPGGILGQVYERFLGKVVRVTPGRQVKIEEKPEVIKAGGVVYTPAFIAEYIVRQVLERLLAGKTPTTAAKLRLLDMACGSGIFLITLYQFLLDWYLAQYSAEPEKWTGKRAPRLYRTPLGEWRLTLDERKRILLDHVYGVDIDPQAVEVTKLSLLLKLLEGETGQTLAPQLALLPQRILPDLNQNIRCGNALIGPEFYDGQMALLDAEEAYRVNVFDWRAAFPAVFAQGGFDGIVGNPPYVRIQRVSHVESDYLFRSYLVPTSKVDLSIVFVERALQLLSASGYVGFITTSQWLSTDYGRGIRGLLSDGRLHRLVDFGSLPVFPTADTYPCIVIVGRQRNPHLDYVVVVDKAQLSLQGIEDASLTSIPVENLTAESWNLRSFDLVRSLNNKQIGWAPLKTYGQAYIGVLTGKDEAFVVTRQQALELALESELLLPYAYRGAEVQRYGNTHPQSLVIYPYIEGEHGQPVLINESEMRLQFPNIFRHLSEYREQLRERMDSRKYYARGSDWYRHLRPGSFAYIRPHKMIIKGIDTVATVGLLEGNTAFNGANAPAIIIDGESRLSPKFFLGLLNSQVVTYHLRCVCPAKLGGYYRFNANNLNSIPIRTIDFADPVDAARHARMVALVEQMLALHQRRAAARTPHEQSVIAAQIAATDRQIDRLVYELYGLSEEEVRIVEGG